MRIGIMAGATQGSEATLDGLLDKAARVEAQGFAALWLANIFGLDAITTLAIAGQTTRRLELGTAVVPTYPRHPTAIAQQALTAQAACSGRFALGIGLSHRIVIEDMFGLSFEKPARHMREYLEVLGPLLRGEQVSYRGELFKVNAQITVPGAKAPQLLVAALGPAMLGITGRLADGTITWMCGPKTLEQHIVPRLTAAARDAGKPAPRVITGLPIVLTRDADAARKLISEQLVIYGQLPSYRSMLDREGAAGPADVSLIGDEGVLARELDRLRDVGVTDFVASVVTTDRDAQKRTLEFLASRTAMATA
ncbi:MAG TPA: TIGR03564 family F420-dependent LLM class oxidoreductase [Thermoanaerobaculia bacterium]|jgi:F420-dependent oxidoreductase-like protein|nr:TIGR03564 family F420-dependent LLM class oxidoreductase [Thermoanaerobaculia bacterium]